MSTKPTHARGPGGVALASAGPPPPPAPALILWPDGFDPTVGAGYSAPAGTIGISGTGGIGWIRPQGYTNAQTWIKLTDAWKVTVNLQPIMSMLVDLASKQTSLDSLAGIASEIVPAMPALVGGVPATGEIAFPAFADLADNQTVIVGGFTYEVQKTGGYVHTVGTVTVDCRACTDENSVAIAFGHTIGIQPGSTVAVSGPVGALLSLLAQTPGPAGNVPITGTVPADFGGMAGGADPIIDLSPIVHTLQGLTVKEHVAPIDSDTLLYYDFRENATLIENHGNGGSLPINWGVQLKRQKDAFSACMDLDSDPSYLGGLLSGMTSVGESPSVTLSCWIYPTRFPDPTEIPSRVWAPLICKGYHDAWTAPYASVAMQLANGAALDRSLGKMQFSITSAGGVQQVLNAPGGSVGYLVLNEWQHVALTYDAVTGTLSAYLNGVLLGTLACPIGAIDWGDHGRWSLGCDGVGAENFSYARIADVRVDQVVRSPAYLQDLYSRGSGQWANALVPTQ